MAAYPADLREELAGRIRSFADDESHAAQAELDVHDHLRREFDPVEVEPSLAIVGGKTPDFWVEGHVAFEVASTFAHESTVVAELVKVLNSIPSRVKVFGLSMRNLSKDKYPKISTPGTESGRLWPTTPASPRSNPSTSGPGTGWT